MRIDPSHVRKLARATEHLSGSPEIKFDILYMEAAMERLTLWERGVLMKALLRAARAKRRSVEHRALLALFVHQEGQNE